MALISWDLQGNGFWDASTNWSGDALPTTADDVLIDTSGEITVTHRSGTTAINRLTSEEALVISGGSLSIQNTEITSETTYLTLSGGTLTGPGTFLVDEFTWTGGNYAGTGLTITEGGTGTLSGGWLNTNLM